MHRHILVIAICLTAVPAYASDKARCTSEDAYQAESAIDNMKTWDDLYRNFKRYATCDDGAIAEGYSDIVGHLLANEWQDLAKLKKLCDSDKSFESFVSKHLDMTISADTWKAMMINASEKCPPNAKSICKMIMERTKERQDKN